MGIDIVYDQAEAVKNHHDANDGKDQIPDCREEGTIRTQINKCDLKNDYRRIDKDKMSRRRNRRMINNCQYDEKKTEDNSNRICRPNSKQPRHHKTIQHSTT